MRSDPPSDPPLPAAYEAALRGDLRGLAHWSGPEEERDAWRAAAHVLLWLGQPRRTLTPTLDSLAAIPPSEGLVQALALHARACLLSLDGEGLARAADLLEPIGGARAALWTRLVRGHQRCLAGDGDGAAALAAEVSDAARERGLAMPRVEAVLLEALAATVRGELPQALHRARLASRMAQAERLWLTHFTASVLLARLRRLGGRPHLAGLIATACLGAAPPIFGGWVRWELLFAGVAPPPGQAESAAERAATMMGEWLVSGHAPEGGGEALEACVSASALHRADAAVAWAASSPTAPLEALDPQARAWLEGQTADAPPALAGLMAPTWAEDPALAAPFALGSPGAARGRRVLGFARPEGYERLEPHGARAARPEAVAAALTLAGEEGIDRASLFELAYGFPFREELHEASFKVVRHHAKRLLETHVSVEREDERVRLRVRAPFCVPDPRTRQPLSEVVLRSLATAGEGSAKDVAERLGIPLRTVQMALRQMIEDGACVVRKDGRRVAYAVEDTTFCELTLA